MRAMVTKVKDCTDSMMGSFGGFGGWISVLLYLSRNFARGWPISFLVFVLYILCEYYMLRIIHISTSSVCPSALSLLVTRVIEAGISQGSCWIGQRDGRLVRRRLDQTWLITCKSVMLLSPACSLNPSVRWLFRKLCPA